MGLKQRVVVTGANGLLGRALISSLCTSVDVLAVVHFPPDNPISNVSYRVVDLASKWDVNVMPDRADVIIHLAQSAKFRNFPDGSMDVFKVNIESTARLLDYARLAGVSRFIYASSGGVYGKGAVAFGENSPIASPGQLGYYLGSKMCSEILAQSYALFMHIVVLRPFFIYGPRQNRTMLIPRLMDNVAAGRPISLQGDSGISINPLHVDDAAAAVVAALTINQSATFNIAGPKVLSIRDICEGMGRYLGCEPVFEIQPGEPEDLVGNNKAMCNQLAPPYRQLLDHLADVSQ